MQKGKLIILGIAGFVIIIVMLMFAGLLPGIKKNINTASADLTMWGFEDAPTIWTELIDGYTKLNPNITIKYTQKDPATFENDIVNALAAGTGPDIWAFKQAWVLKHKNKVYPLPEALLQFDTANFENFFADAASVFIQEKQIVALPISIDTLALYYNKDILNSENIPNPPVTWEELTDAVKKTSKISPSGSIVQSGIAMGTTRNIDHLVHIISALFLQNGLKVMDFTGEEPKADISRGESIESATNALAYYLSFSDSVTKSYSWSDTLPNSISAFAGGRVAMILGFASDYDRIKEKNPRLNFGIAPLPQRKGEAVKKNYGISTGLTVSRTSKAPVEAWRFIIYATSNPEAVKFYLNSAIHPPAYRQYVTADFLAPYLDVFKAQVLSARTWLQADEREVSAIFQTMVQSSRGNLRGINQAVTSAGKQLEDLTKPYMFKPPEPPPKK